MEAKRFRGRVKFFATRKGYGFIQVEGTGESIFVHRIDLAGLLVGKGDLVEFGIEASRKGPIAVHIQRIIEADSGSETGLIFGEELT